MTMRDERQERAPCLEVTIRASWWSRWLKRIRVRPPVAKPVDVPQDGGDVRAWEQWEYRRPVPRDAMSAGERHAAENWIWRSLG